MIDLFANMMFMVCPIISTIRRINMLYIYIPRAKSCIPPIYVWCDVYFSISIFFPERFMHVKYKIFWRKIISIYFFSHAGVVIGDMGSKIGLNGLGKIPRETVSNIRVPKQLFRSCSSTSNQSRVGYLILSYNTLISNIGF